MQTALSSSRNSFRKFEPYSPEKYQRKKAAMKLRVDNGPEVFGTLRINAQDIDSKKLWDVGMSRRETTFAKSILVELALLAFSRPMTPRSAPTPVQAPVGCREAGWDEIAYRVGCGTTTLKKYAPFFKAAKFLDFIPHKDGVLFRIFKLENFRPFARPKDSKTENEAWNCLRKIMPKRKQSTGSTGSSPSDDNRVSLNRTLSTLSSFITDNSLQKQEKQRTVSQNSYYVFSKGEKMATSQDYRVWFEDKKRRTIELLKNIGRSPTQNC